MPPSPWQDFTFDLPSSPNLVIRFEAFTSAGGEMVGIDNVRLVPEPATCTMLALALGGFCCLAPRRRVLN